jgi:hypothetical protein
VDPDDESLVGETAESYYQLRRRQGLARGAAAGEARLAELRRLVEDADGLEPGREDELKRILLRS